MNAHSWLAPRGRNNQSGSGFSQKDEAIEKRRIFAETSAIWVELANAIGSKLAETIRGNAERSVG
jgi:hypothetical protein